MSSTILRTVVMVPYRRLTHTHTTVANARTRSRTLDVHAHSQARDFIFFRTRYLAAAPRDGHASSLRAATAPYRRRRPSRPSLAAVFLSLFFPLFFFFSFFSSFRTSHAHARITGARSRAAPHCCYYYISPSSARTLVRIIFACAYTRSTAKTCVCACVV